MPSPDSPQSVPADGDGVGMCELESCGEADGVRVVEGDAAGVVVRELDCDLDGETGVGAGDFDPDREREGDVPGDLLVDGVLP